MTTSQDFSRALAAVVGDAIKADRRTQRDVADAAGIPLVTLNRRLTATSPFTVLELAAVAKVLDVSVTDLALRAERSASTNTAA